MVLHIAIFGYMQDGNLTDPNTNSNHEPNPNLNCKSGSTRKADR